MPETMGRTRPVTHEEARDIVRRLIAGSFRRDGERLEGKDRPNFSIPTRPNHDDDCLIIAYIEQQKTLAARQALIDQILAEEGATVTLTGGNPDFNGLPNHCVEVVNSATQWEGRGFRGDTVEDCLRQAIDRGASNG